MLFCITANYTPQALEAMGKNPNTNRREAVEKLVTAAGGKLVAMYGTVAEGPGAMVMQSRPSSCPCRASTVMVPRSVNLLALLMRLSSACRRRI